VDKRYGVAMVDVVKIAPKSSKIGPKMMVFDMVFDMVLKTFFSVLFALSIFLALLHNRVFTGFCQDPKLVVVLISS
jgi:hypothetical protein